MLKKKQNTSQNLSKLISQLQNNQANQLDRYSNNFTLRNLLKIPETLPKKRRLIHQNSRRPKKQKKEVFKIIMRSASSKVKQDLLQTSCKAR